MITHLLLQVTVTSIFPSVFVCAPDLRLACMCQLQGSLVSTVTPAEEETGAAGAPAEGRTGAAGEGMTGGGAVMGTRGTGTLGTLMYDVPGT
jgi:hypothetical protein